MLSKTLRFILDTHRQNQQKQVATVTLSREGFRRAIALERARADRNEREFSVLLLHGDALTSAVGADHWINRLAKRIRIIDRIGWFDERRIGVLLPYTSSDGALTLANDISHMTIPSPPIFSVYTYPGHWLPDETPTSGAASDSEGEAG